MKRKTVITIEQDAHEDAKDICATTGRKIGHYATEAIREKNEREEAAIKALKRGNRRGGKAA